MAAKIEIGHVDHQTAMRQIGIYIFVYLLCVVVTLMIGFVIHPPLKSTLAWLVALTGGWAGAVVNYEAIALASSSFSKVCIHAAAFILWYETYKFVIAHLERYTWLHP